MSRTVEITATAGKKLQWHQAFYASIQIEFEKEAEKLIFENEHHLGTQPKRIDVVIIKKMIIHLLKRTSEKSFASIILLNINLLRIILALMITILYMVMLVYINQINLRNQKLILKTSQSP